MSDHEHSVSARPAALVRRLRLGSPVARVAVLGLPLVAMTSTLTASGQDTRWVVPSSTSSGNQAWLDQLVGPVPPGWDETPPPDVAVVPSGGDPKVLVLPGPAPAGGAAGSARGAAAPAGGPDTGALTSSGIPVRVLQAYVAAAKQTGRIDPGCHVAWSLLAGIGRVETDHGRYGGAAVDANGVVHPAIYGPRLDGTLGMPFIHDTDGGRLDGDSTSDRAVGPMQFLPGTWAGYGTDADGDGVANPQDIDDAALSAARYLCAGGGDLGTQAGRFQAVFRYNQSTSYVRLVLALADSYASGTAVSAGSEPTEPVTRTATPATVGSPPAVNPDPLPAPASSEPVQPAGRPSPTPQASPSTSPHPTPSASPSASPSTSPSASPSPSPSTSPKPSPSPSPSASPSTSPSPSPPPTPSPDPSPAAVPSPTSSAAPSPTPSAHPSPTPSASPTTAPSASAAADPAASPSPTSSASPSASS